MIQSILNLMNSHIRNKMAIYIIVIITILLNSCKSSNTDNDIIKGNTILDTTYYKNGKAKIIQAYIDGKKNGVYEQYDSTGNMIELGYFVNDTINGILMSWADNDFGTLYYYDNGKCILVEENFLTEKQYQGKRFGTIINRSTLQVLGTLMYKKENGHLVLKEEFSSFYDVSQIIDTTQVNDTYQLPIAFYNHRIPTKKKIKLYIKSNKNNSLLVDTLLGNENNKFTINFKPIDIGYYKIVGIVTYEFFDNKEEISIPMPFFKDFYVKEK